MPRSRKPNSYVCPTCGARRGQPCVKTRGPNKGQPYPDETFAHKARIAKAAGA